MERSLVWSALAIGFACWIVGFSLTRRQRFALAGIGGALAPAYLATAIGLPILLFIATLPSRGRFFAPGHDLGNGFLLGAVGALLSSVLVIQHMLAASAETSRLRSAAVVASPFGLGVACAATPLLVPHDTLSIALLGVAIGWLAITGILLLGLVHGPRAQQACAAEPLCILAGACFVAMLSATIALGDFHGEVSFIKTTTSVSWAVLAVAAAAAIPLFVLLCAASDVIFNPDARVALNPQAVGPLADTASIRARIGRAAIVVVGVGIVGRLLANRVIDSGSESDSAAAVGRMAHAISTLIGPSRLFHVLGLGIVVGLLVWWISSTAHNPQQDETESEPEFNWRNGALGILIALAGAMSAYQTLAGFGVGLMLIGVWPAVCLAILRAFEPTEAQGDSSQASARHTETARRMVQTAAMGTILALFRVYTTMNDGLFPHSPYTDQYAAFGFVAGGVLPLFLSGFVLAKSKRDGSYVALARLFVSGALILAIPSLVLLLWGQKCVMAFLIALAITASGIGSTNTVTSFAAGIRRIFPAIYAIGLALALCEWSHYVLDTEDWTRVQKERVLVQIGVAAILIVLASEYGGHAVTWLKRDRLAEAGPKSNGNNTKGAAR